MIALAALMVFAYWFLSEKILNFPKPLYLLSFVIGVLFVAGYGILNRDQFVSFSVQKWILQSVYSLVIAAVIAISILTPIDLAILLLKKQPAEKVQLPIDSVRFTGNDKAFYRFENRLYSVIISGDDRFYESKQAFKNYEVEISACKSILGTYVLDEVQIVAK